MIQRDAFLNALGGVRLPEFEHPTNSYFSPNNTGKPNCAAPGAPPFPACNPPEIAALGALACFLSGSLAPLPQASIDQLYRNHGSYVSGIAHSANGLVAARFLLPEDAEAHKTSAGEASIGKKNAGKNK